MSLLPFFPGGDYQAVIASEAKQSPSRKEKIASAEKRRLAMTPAVVTPGA